MSYFNDDSQPQNSSDQASQSNNPEDFVAKLVTEKGEQWSDPNTIAKGYASSQEFIGTLQRQIAEMQEDLSKQDYSKELLQALKTPNPTAQGTPPVQAAAGMNPSSDGTNTPVSLDETAIKNLISNTLTQREAQATSEQNLRAVDEALTKTFGTEVNAKVEAKRAELGLSKEKLQEIAQESPSAFLALMGEAPKQEVNKTIQGSVNTAAAFQQSNSGVRDFNYYQEMRRTNRKQYYTPAVQAQMLKDSKELGSKFY